MDAFVTSAQRGELPRFDKRSQVRRFASSACQVWHALPRELSLLHSSPECQYRRASALIMTWRDALRWQQGGDNILQHQIRDFRPIVVTGQKERFSSVIHDIMKSKYFSSHSEDFTQHPTDICSRLSPPSSENNSCMRRQ